MPVRGRIIFSNELQSGSPRLGLDNAQEGLASWPLGGKTRFRQHNS
jgi:hypothetical protein